MCKPYIKTKPKLSSELIVIVVQVLKLDKYIEVFAVNHINAVDLASYSDQDLLKLGLPLGGRK